MECFVYAEEYAEKYPAILPKKHHLLQLIIHHSHEKVHHQGRLITLAAIRNGGYWIIGASRTVSKMLSNCVMRRELRGKFLTQHMADLPPDRTETPPPFTNVGFDMFGPWTIYAKRTRGGMVNAKRWGIIFTCMNSRAIHIEVLETLDSGSSFICSLRGPVSLLRSNCGTNFIGGKSELDDASREEELVKIEKWVTEQECQWLLNPPHASHFGGTWQRQIGTVHVGSWTP